MSDRLRLDGGGVEPAGETIAFTFEARPVEARAGESLAAALIAAGEIALRQAGPDERRGVFCGMGVCHDCLVEIDGRGGQRACMTEAKPGMAVRRHDPARAALRPLGDPPDRNPPLQRAGVVIIGAGPAGLAAAKCLAEAGLEPVIIDEREAPGGQYFKPLAASHRFAPGGEDEQFSRGRRLVADVVAAGAEIRSGHAVWQGAASEAGVELGVTGPAGAYVIAAKAVLVATGAYERSWPIPGWTLPGVMTTGAAQTLARRYRVAPGKRVLVAGNGPLNWQVALEIARGGGHVVAVIESARPFRPALAGAALGLFKADPRLAWQGARMRLALARAGVPLLTGHHLVAIEGDGAARTAHAAPVAGGRARRFAVDAVALGHGFIPATALIRMLGCPVEVDPATSFARPVRAVDGRAGRGMVWIAGDAGDGGGSRVAEAEGTIAAQGILRALGHAKHSRGGEAMRAKARAVRFQRHLWTLFAAPEVSPATTAETIICRCENVTAGAIDAARADGIRDLGSLKRQTRLGMGRCQGRYCAGEALRRLAEGDLGHSTPADLFAPQAPEKPVPAILLASEKPEWTGHREVETGRRPPQRQHADPLPARCDLLIIGAGVIGISAAMQAAGHGMDTVVVDRSPPNSEASGSNAGSLHVQLLSFDFGRKAMAGGDPALQTLPLQRDAVLLWKELEAALGEDFEITTTGGLMVAENLDQTAFLRRKVEAERSVGIEVEVVGRDDLASLAPEIAERMVVASYCPLEGKINPLKATPALAREAIRRGARISSGHEVTAIRRDAEGFTVATDHATILARQVVIAAGGWSRHVGRLAGIDLPINGSPLQMLVTEPTRPLLTQLVAHADRHLSLKQAANGNLIIGGAWTAGADIATGFARVLRPSIEGNLHVAARTLPALAGLHLLRSWAAMNVNIDGAPLIGPVPGMPGLFVAATANGYTLGPLIGRIAADCARGRPLTPAMEMFSLARFG